MALDIVLPPRDGIPVQLARVAEQAESAASQQRAWLVGMDGAKIELPSEVYLALRGVVRAMSQGQAVTIMVSDSTLTTQQAATLLGVSRPTVTKLLDRGEIPSTRPGRHRRVQLQDVLAYREQRRQTRLEGLAAMAEISQSMGLYDEADQAPIRRH